MRLMSASGPFGPLFFGVWQSWQPPPMTNCLPRSTCDRAGAAAGALAGALSAPGASTGGALLQAESATAAAAQTDSRATRDGNKRMGLNSSGKGEESFSLACAENDSCLEELHRSVLAAGTIHHRA